jgi:acetylornithine deacetylase/succinyl-diaminopimelate desuccinylase-like protein
VQRELEAVLAETGIEHEVQAYRSLLGHEGKGIEPLVSALEQAYAHLFHTQVQAEESRRASIWTDTNVYNEMGIPAIKFGPRGKRIRRTEELSVDTMLKAAQVYALIALDICNQTPPRA